MSDPATRLPRMTAEEFIAWAREQPEGKQYELLDGVILDQASERSARALMKGLVYRRLAEEIERLGLPCTVYPDGMAVRIDAMTVYEPDSLVRRGPPLPPDEIFVTDPVIVAEVRSPSTASRDTAVKLPDYVRLPSLRHYLVFRTDKPSAVHYVRDEHGGIATRLVTGGAAIALDPPDLILRRWFPEG